MKEKPPWLWIGLIAVIVVLGIVAVVASSGSEDEGPLEVGAVTITGDSLPVFDGENDPGNGLTAPTVVGESFDGSPVSIETGRPTLVLFVAHWCPHCQREVPVLVEHLAASPLPDGVDLVTVSTAVDPSRPNSPPSAWLEDEGWDQPVLMDDADGSVADAFGLTGFPFLVGLDAEGKVVARGSGEFTTEQFDAFVTAATR